MLNHLKPHRIRGEPGTFSLEEEIIIDTEREDLFIKGLGSAGEFAVDSKGSIYIVGFKNPEYFINKFDSKGELVHSFGRRGQGPGELTWPMGPIINRNDEFSLTDHSSKQVVFDGRGYVLSETVFPTSIMRLTILKSGRFLVYKINSAGIESGGISFHLAICDSDFRLIKELDVDRNPYDDSRMVPFFMYRVSGDHIFIANQERGYEIWMFDLNGRLVRKIRKDYRPVTPSDRLKEAVIGPRYQEVKAQLKEYFPDPMPPFNSFFTDECGRLFVMTYEAGDKEGEYLYDLFNPDGAFIGRKSLNLMWAGLYLGPHYAMVRYDRLYCYRIKPNGYQELVVSRMIWH